MSSNVRDNLTKAHPILDERRRHFTEPMISSDGLLVQPIGKLYKSSLSLTWLRTKVHTLQGVTPRKLDPDGSSEHLNICVRS
jgi:hypothetical protein